MGRKPSMKATKFMATSVVFLALWRRLILLADYLLSGAKPDASAMSDLLLISMLFVSAIRA